MKVRLKRVEPGDNSSQKVVEISTADGTAFLAVDSSQIQDGEMLEVGGPVGMDKNQEKYLVELPQETFSGAWRVWIPIRQLVGA
jgi:hypothetical protein